MLSRMHPVLQPHLRPGVPDLVLLVKSAQCLWMDLDVVQLLNPYTALY